jgi:hypothetical protein
MAGSASEQLRSETARRAAETDRAVAQRLACHCGATIGCIRRPANCIDAHIRHARVIGNHIRRRRGERRALSGTAERRRTDSLSFLSEPSKLPKTLQV